MMDKLRDYFKKRNIYIWKETFAIAKCKRIPSNAFAIVQDKNEITAIIDQAKINSKNIIKMNKGWKIFTFDMVMPFGLVGFLSKISRVLAEENISIFVISGYSTDHVLVKTKDLKKAKKELENIGCVVEYYEQFRPEYIEKLEKIRKEKPIKIGSIDDMRKRLVDVKEGRIKGLTENDFKDYVKKRDTRRKLE